MPEPRAAEAAAPETTANGAAEPAGAAEGAAPSVAAPAPDASAAAPTPSPASVEQTSTAPSAERSPAPPSGEPPFKLEPVSASELAAAASASGALFAKGGGAEEARDFGPAPEQLTLEDHLFLEKTREARARDARLWAGGAALVLLALVAQVAFFYRGEIAAHAPAVRPQLTRLCEMMGCVIDLPQRPQLIAIEASDLQAIDPARPAVIQLTATVRNHAGYDLGFPALDLVLTNNRDHTLARRIFQPQRISGAWKKSPGRDPGEGGDDDQPGARHRGFAAGGFPDRSDGRLAAVASALILPPCIPDNDGHSFESQVHRRAPLGEGGR